LLVGGKKVSSNEHFFEPYKNLAVQLPQITADAVRTPTGFKVTLSSDKFARAVYLSTGSSAGKLIGFFTDNYFDLIPGRTVGVEFRTDAAIPAVEFRDQLKIRSMVDAF